MDLPSRRSTSLLLAWAALVVRSYLAGKQLKPGEFVPPADPKVRKAVFVGGEHFGTPLANSVNLGEQLPALSVGSQFTWDLATWHQGVDDMREVDAIALAGKGTSKRARRWSGTRSRRLARAGRDSLGLPRSVRASCQSATTGPRASFAIHRKSSWRWTRRLTLPRKSSGPFLDGTDDWKQIGETPLEDANLSAGGGLISLLRMSPITLLPVSAR